MLTTFLLGASIPEPARRLWHLLLEAPAPAARSGRPELPSAAAQAVVLHRLAGLVEPARTIEDLPPTLLPILETFRELAASGQVSAPADSAATALRGFLVSHPEFSALWHTPSVPSRAVDLVHLSLVSALHARPEIGASADFASARKEAALAARMLSGPKEKSYQDLMAEAAEGVTTFAALSEHLNRLRDKYIDDNPFETSAPRRVSAITCLVRYFSTDKWPKRRDIGGTRHSVVEVETDLTDEPSDGGVPIEFAEPMVVERFRQECAAAPRSERPRPQLIAVSVNTGLVEQNAASSLNRIAANQARARTSAAQKLPGAGDRLQLHDLESFFRWTSEDPDLEGRLLRELAATVWLVSGPPEKVINIRVAQTLAEANDPTAVAYLVLDIQCWKIFVPPLHKAFRPASGQTEYYEEVDSWFLLPTPTGWPVMTRLLARAQKIGDGPLFPGDLGKWRAALRQELAQANKQYRCRLSGFRVASFLSRFAADLSGDRAEGSLLSLADDPSGCAARLYYYAPRKADLATKYCQAVESAFRNLQPAAGAAIKRPDPSLLGGRIGSAGVPREAVVARAVSELLTTVPPLRRGRPTRAWLIDFHNRLAIYTTTALLWMTGIRAIRDPIELDLTDLESGYLTISDKDGDEYADARVVWIPALGIEQLREYDRHRRALLSRTDFAGMRPSHWLFVITNGLPQPITPKVLTEYWGSSFPFRSNSQRHYLRTRLRESGVPGEAVDAFLGHGGFGEEAYSRYSCLSPRDLRSALHGPLTAIIASCGWKLLRGLS